MPIVTSIKPQKNNKQSLAGGASKRLNIYLDYKFAFGIDLENFVKFNLRVDQELKEEEIQLIKDESERKKILDKVLRFAMIRPRSEKEVKDYLKRKNISGLVYGYVFDKLKEFKLLDDLEFAKWWINERIQYKSKSKKEIIYELRIKGIKQEIINEVLENTQIDEIKIAKDLVDKRMYKWVKLEPKIRKQKITQYLLSKGFDWNVTKDVIEYILGVNDYE